MTEDRDDLMKPEGEEKQKKKAINQLEKSYSDMLATPAGRAVMVDLLKEFQVFAQLRVAGNAEITTVNAAVHDKGIALLNRLKQYAPDHYQQVIEELTR